MAVGFDELSYDESFLPNSLMEDINHHYYEEPVKPRKQLPDPVATTALAAAMAAGGPAAVAAAAEAAAAGAAGVAAGTVAAAAAAGAAAGKAAALTSWTGTCSFEGINVEQLLKESPEHSGPPPPKANALPGRPLDVKALFQPSVNQGGDGPAQPPPPAAAPAPPATGQIPTQAPAGHPHPTRPAEAPAGAQSEFNPHNHMAQPGGQPFAPTPAQHGPNLQRGRVVHPGAQVPAHFVQNHRNQAGGQPFAPVPAHHAHNQYNHMAQPSGPPHVQQHLNYQAPQGAPVHNNRPVPPGFPPHFNHHHNHHPAPPGGPGPNHHHPVPPAGPAMAGPPQANGQPWYPPGAHHPARPQPCSDCVRNSAAVQQLTHQVAQIKNQLLAKSNHMATMRNDLHITQANLVEANRRGDACHWGQQEALGIMQKARLECQQAERNMRELQAKLQKANEDNASTVDALKQQHKQELQQLLMHLDRDDGNSKASSAAASDVEEGMGGLGNAAWGASNSMQQGAGKAVCAVGGSFALAAAGGATHTALLLSAGGAAAPGLSVEAQLLMAQAAQAQAEAKLAAVRQQLLAKCGGAAARAGPTGGDSVGVTMRQEAGEDTVRVRLNVTGQ